VTRAGGVGVHVMPNSCDVIYGQPPVHYIIAMEDVLGSARPSLTFLILNSLPLSQTIASSAVILGDQKCLIHW
jgi:hypothetical protein